MARGRGVRRDGRSKKARFLKLDHSVYDSVAYKDLGLAAKVILWELIRRHNGVNNGRIALPVRAGHDLGIGQSTTGRALRELVASGLVTCERRSAFTVKTRLAAEFGLAWLPIDGRAPTLGWRVGAQAETKHSATTSADSPIVDAVGGYGRG